MENTENKMENIYVGLNVGGTIYKTLRTTLLKEKDSFLSKLISGDNPSEITTDEQGNYLIDRDGEIFRHILNFLRNGTLLLPRGFKDLSLLEREADFFMLESLKKEIPVGINCAGTIVQVPRSDFDRVPTSCLREILSGQKVTPMDADGNVVLDIPLSHFHHLREYLKLGNNGKSTTRFMLGDSNIRASLTKAADLFGLDVLQAHVSSVQRMAMGKDNLERFSTLLLDLYYDSSDELYTVYCTGSRFLDVDAETHLTLHDMGDGVHGANFTWNKDRAGTDVQYLIKNKNKSFPPNWEEMVNSMITSVRKGSTYGVSHITTDVCASCKKAEFTEYAPLY